ncbi:MAG: hypothetical protein M0C28_08235 [Candidatus Moduliflexus flocculans]|nr:hypothetical protein [Candidatus Moduliflexus flocculans]
MNKAGLSVSVLAAAFLLAAVSPAHGAAPSSPSKTGPAGVPQSNPGEPDLARWEKQLTLPPHVTARLDWARRSFVPSGYRKLESLAQAKASAIAGGRTSRPWRRKRPRTASSAPPGSPAGMLRKPPFSSWPWPRRTWTTTSV